MEVFKRFEEDDIVRANPTQVSTGLWSSDTGSLVAFYTSSEQTASAAGQHFWDIYNINPSSSLAEIQFSLAYGNINGGGASVLADDDNALLATKAVYFQYRNVLLDPGDTHFTFLPTSDGATFNADEIFVINIHRQRLKEKLDPGNWSLTLAYEAGGLITRSFIDDSGQTLGEQFGTSGRVFNVVSGSLTGVSGSTVVASSSVSGGFGLVYPDMGIIILNPRALFAVSASAATVTTNPDLGSAGNQKVLLNSMIGGDPTNGAPTSLTADFQARSAENIASTHYFVRLRNKELNYSNNPSFFNEANGVILNSGFIQDPQVFVTTVGLYNDANELLAVGKLSQPTRKSFDRELLIRVRLDF
jgi:hypothetical protein